VLKDLLWARSMIVVGLILTSCGPHAFSQQSIPKQLPIEVHLSQAGELAPKWLQVLDKLSWPLIVLVSVVLFRIPLTGVIKTLAEGGAEFSLGSVKVRLPELEKKIENQQGKIDEQNEQIRDLIKFSMSFYIYQMLFELQKAKGSDGGYMFRNNGSMDRNLRFLIDHGYIEEVPHWPSDGENISPMIVVTAQGRDVIAMRGAP
jgi:hypothetical protein